MRIERSNFFILTGGPGAGKTTIIEELRRRGFLCVDEVARAIIQEQLRTGGNAMHTGDQIKFRDLMLARSIATYEEVVEREAPVFFDRGMPELVGYSHLIGTEVPDQIRRAVARYRYAETAFIAPPWEDIYCNDAERVQDFGEAVESYEAMVVTYPQVGYRLVEVPKGPVAARADFILNHVFPGS
jgi:predicted ATPase